MRSWPLVITCLTLPAVVTLSRAPARADPLDALYARAAADLDRGRPLLIVVHVALCQNGIIWCGGGGHGDGDEPRRNLYWGGAAGFRAYFDRAAGYRRVHLDAGDGKDILERAVYRKQVSAPSPAWRRRGVTRAFDVVLVGLAYRGYSIDMANDDFIRHVVGTKRPALPRLDRRRLPPLDGAAHLVGYAGHDRLMESPNYEFPRSRRKLPVAYFALSCDSALFLAKPLASPLQRAVLLSLSLMYPGAFTIDGLVQGLADGAPEHDVFIKGAQHYARFQKRPEAIIRRAFINDSEPRFWRRFGDPAATTLPR